VTTQEPRQSELLRLLAAIYKREEANRERTE
jgi:hypothetical protein